MENYIAESLKSILNQLDERFEVVVIDDGSSDNSLQILRELESSYPLLRVLSFERSPLRKLGETRNLSIRNARENGIVEWCLNALKLSNKFDDKVFISGKQINFVNRDFILSFGGYRNIYYTEDRDLWARLAGNNSIIFIDHPVFRKRMALSTNDKITKITKVTWNVILNDLTTGRTINERIYEVTKSCFTQFFYRGKLVGPLRLILLLPAIIYSFKKGIILDYRPVLPYKKYSCYKNKNTKTFDEWLI
jgi:glycosyltransferase involved in cell wall biosynthesis